jgi:hypothetical protein
MVFADSLFNQQIEVPHVSLREEMELHMISDIRKQILEIQIWWNNKMTPSINLPVANLRVHC